MSAFSIADAKAKLPSLIDRALAGEEVVITRHGKPVVELRPKAASPTGSALATTEWLLARTMERTSAGITSVELLDQVYDPDRQ